MKRKVRTRSNGVERRSIGASTSRRINSFGLQIHRRSVYEPYRFDQLRERLSRNERSKIKSRREVNCFAPFVFDFVKFHFSLHFFSPLFLPLLRVPPFFVSSSMRSRCKNRREHHLPFLHLPGAILFWNNKLVFTRGRRATNSRGGSVATVIKTRLSRIGDRLSMQLVIGACADAQA